VADLPGARAVFSSRASGNVGRFIDPVTEEIAAARARLAGRVGTTWDGIHHGHQVHGTTVVTDAELGLEADGQVSSARPALVFVADCLPILLSDGEMVGALHCGHPPLAGGIIAKGVDALAGEVTAAIGPGARGCCYEVGPELHERFARYDARRGDNLDLPTIAAQQLREAGVETILDSGICTICDPRFYSYRRDHTTERQAGIVCPA
jgi:YfiH family protein